MRPFGGAKLAAFAAIAAVGLELGAAIASAGVAAPKGGPPPTTSAVVNPGGNSGGGYNPNRCQQSWHANKWYCQPSTSTSPTTKPPQVVVPSKTTATQPTTSTTTAGAVPPADDPVVPSRPQPAVAGSGGDDDSIVALPGPATTPPADTPQAQPRTPVGGIADFFERGSRGGVPLSMVLVIALAGLATVALVLRGTFGRGANAAASGEGESLKFN